MACQDMNTVIADNLREIRKGLGISLGEMAEKTGVSKSMIGQIERGESSPTISTLWKIATGLNIPFTTLLQMSGEEVQITKEADLRPVLNDHGHFRLFPIVPIRFDRNFEMLDLILDPSAVSESAPHADGTVEYVFVYEGEMTIMLGEAKTPYVVNEGSVIHYPANQRHTYRNDSGRIVRAVMVIQYK